MVQKSIQRVLVFATNYLPNIGGAELAFSKVAERINNIEFDLITSRLNKQAHFDSSIPVEEKIRNINIYRVGSKYNLMNFILPKNFYPLTAFFKALKLNREHGPYKIIYAVQASQGGGGAWLFKTFNPRATFILNLQEGKILKAQGFLTNFFRSLIIRKANIVVAISNYLADYARRINFKAKIIVIPNGVDLINFPTSNPPAGGQFPIKEKKEKIIITTSRLVDKNGVGDLIEAFKILTIDYRLSTIDYRLIIVGDGLLRNNYESRVKNYGLEDKVKLIGEVSNEELPKYLRKADVFVRPSISEGLGIAFLEAMAVGLPIIGTQVGGIPDFLKNGETGIFCKVGDPEDIAQKIHMILSDNDLRERLIFNGQKLVKEKYDWDKIAIQFENLYATI